MKEEGGTVARAIQLNGDTNSATRVPSTRWATGGVAAANAQLTRFTLDANRIEARRGGARAGAQDEREAASLNGRYSVTGRPRRSAARQHRPQGVAPRVRITANGTAHLLDALMSNTALENLDLSGNKIGDAGALEVARWLQNHPQTSLASLELRGADITAAGAQAIADVVWPRPPPHLIDLDLRGNIISRGVSVGDHMGELPPPIQWDGPDGQYYQ